MAARAAQEGLKRHQKADKKHGFLRIPAGTPSGVVLGWIFDDFGKDFGRILEGFWKNFGRILEGFWKDSWKDFRKWNGTKKITNRCSIDFHFGFGLVLGMNFDQSGIATCSIWGGFWEVKRNKGNQQSLLYGLSFWRKRKREFPRRWKIHRASRSYAKTGLF